MYEIEYLVNVGKEDIPLLSKDIKTIIKKTIEKKLMTDPITFGKPLRYSFKGFRSLRVGDYRVIYRIEPGNSKVIIAAIKHRSKVYED